jgi:hypothetical protein
MAGGRNVTKRALTPADLGLDGTSAIVDGSVRVKNGTAIVQIDFLGRGAGSLGGKALNVLPSLKKTARELGAGRLRIETTRIIEKTGSLNRILDMLGFGTRKNGTRFFETSL